MCLSRVKMYLKTIYLDGKNERLKAEEPLAERTLLPTHNLLFISHLYLYVLLSGEDIPSAKGMLLRSNILLFISHLYLYGLISGADVS